MRVASVRAVSTGRAAGRTRRLTACGVRYDRVQHGGSSERDEFTAFTPNWRVSSAASRAQEEMVHGTGDPTGRSAQDRLTLGVANARAALKELLVQAPGMSCVEYRENYCRWTSAEVSGRHGRRRSGSQIGNGRRLDPRQLPRRPEARERYASLLDVRLSNQRLAVEFESPIAATTIDFEVSFTNG